MRWLFCVGILFFGQSLLADCISETMQALQICKSEKPIQDAQSQRQEIEKHFRPANGRMSPESCQGFSDAYDKYKQLTENYIQSCQQKIEGAGSTCESDAENAVKGTPAEFQHFLDGVKRLREAKSKLPNLQALIPPMDNLKGLVMKSCLKDLPGRVVNTDTDRGDAALGRIQTTDGGSASGGGADSTYFGGHSSGKSGGRIVLSATGMDRTRVGQEQVLSQKQGTVGDGRIVPQDTVSAGVAKNGMRPGELGGGPDFSATVKADPLSAARAEQLARLRHLSSRRAPSSVLAEFAAKHSNIFIIIRRRYIVERSNLY